MSLKKIADKLGISVATVSRALNGQETVSQATRERVFNAAQRMGIQPNALASRLKMGKTNAIALVYPNRLDVLDDSSLLQMVNMISMKLSNHHLDFLLLSCEIDGDLGSLERLVESRRVDAVLAAHTLPQDPRLEYLQKQRFPFLALGRSRLSQPYAWFDFDNHAGTTLATAYLIELGHRRIAFLSTDYPLSYAEQRLQGYGDTLRKHALFDDRYIIKTAASRRGGYLAMKRLLALTVRPTAVITDCNMLGDGAAIAIEEWGASHHEEISLISYDGLPEDSLASIPVTAIVQSTRNKVGQQIVEMLLRLLNGDNPETLQVLWQPELSCGKAEP
ncbi:substrate-binding domain-containing protein [Brenneria populi subsp. brevivirga]|uniref:substrate-binding domain-containing protein n=1 Tax=Brenneria populi TaxID=1505588 RepID=UPI002E178AD3|nr:substrate-binding domain-containing protein [Brenneria populi subsp. brevivirga]